jgi:hypothetical protein
VKWNYWLKGFIDAQDGSLKYPELTEKIKKALSETDGFRVNRIENIKEFSMIEKSK